MTLLTSSKKQGFPRYQPLDLLFFLDDWLMTGWVVFHVHPVHRQVMHSSLSTHVKRYKPWREQMRRKTALGQKPQAVASLSFVCFRGARVFSFREIQTIIYTESIYIYELLIFHCQIPIARGFFLTSKVTWNQKTWRAVGIQDLPYVVVFNMNVCGNMWKQSHEYP